MMMFVLGTLLGGTVGMVSMALCAAAKDDKYE